MGQAHLQNKRQSIPKALRRERAVGWWHQEPHLESGAILQLALLPEGHPHRQRDAGGWSGAAAPPEEPVEPWFEARDGRFPPDDAEAVSDLADNPVNKHFQKRAAT